MEAFKPIETPTWKKIVFNPFLHVAIIAVLVFATILFIRQRQRDELRARVEYLKGGPVLVERTQPTSGANATASEATSAQADGQTPAAAPSATETGAINATQMQGTAAPDATIAARSALAGTASGAAGANAAVNRSAPNRAVVIYAEIDRRTLNTWMNEIRTSGHLRTFDSVTMGPIPQIDQKLKGAGVKILQQLEFSLLNQTSPLEWFAGTHRGADPENEMGFFSSLVIGDIKEGLIRGELEVQRAFRDPSDPSKAMERVSFGGPFEMTIGSGFVMRGLLPSRYGADLGDENNSDPFLSVFKSRSFRTEETEFALIVDFDNGGPQNK